MRLEVLQGDAVTHRQSKEQDHLRQPGRHQEHDHESAPARHDVIRSGQRANQIQVDRAFPAIPAQQLRRDNRREHEHDGRGDAVEIVMRGQVQLLRRPGACEAFRRTGDHRHDETNRRQHRHEEPGQDLRASPAAEPQRDTDPVLVDRHAGPAPTLTLTGVIPVADVEDGALVSLAACDTARCRCRHARSNSSVSARRRGAMRRSAAWDSTSESRMWSYTVSSGPSIVRPLPSIVERMPRRSSAATSASRLVSTSMKTVSVSFVKCPTSPDSTSWPPWSTMMRSQVRSTSAMRCEEKSTLMPKSRWVFRTSSSISSRPNGSRPAVGSSRKTNAGSCTRAWPSFTRCFMPVEYPPIERYRSSNRPVCRSVSAARVRATVGGKPLASAMCVRNSAALTCDGRQSCSGMYPSRERTPMFSDAFSPSTIARPDVGGRSPRKILIAVLLPAPFSPRIPVMPS